MIFKQKTCLLIHRYWDLVQTHKVTQFYTAPTAIRALIRYDTAPIADYDLSSLRVLGSVGEPINPEAWKWVSYLGPVVCVLCLSMTFVLSQLKQLVIIRS